MSIILEGATSIHKGFTSSTFASVPDVPVSRFELTLPTGPHSALAGTGNLCYRTIVKRRRVKLRRHGHVVKRKGRVVYRSVKVRRRVRRRLTMPTSIEGQNGAVVSQQTKLAVQGCGKAARRTPPHGHRARRHGSHGMPHRKG